ncbi:hypothetical protein M1M34_gp114 [Haloarcula tailed virus 2]|uniref:Uncharacterized protein n=1 Tax=Haloarcula tailed virus 2 TaxID=2877989 RepID=A0AAE8XZX7_9CAUD|nr:hypothetical protein M1M34_gp114 [Haloarcula tailed virus 2]UBF23219.1 hypothetical protein HATV-2_gp68 [Haloarcula tailed virus 2]
MNIQADKQREVKHEIYRPNVVKDFVDYSRCLQLLNEEQAVATLMVYLTGLLPDDSDNAAAYITGGSSGGKTHMKDKVIDNAFKLRDNEKDHWLFSTTSTSAKGLIDDPLWDKSRIAALNELNKIGEEMLEFLKSVHGDDGGHDYTRNQANADAESGFESVHVGSKSLPVVFMLADENKMNVEAELTTRMIEIKVDETEEKNAGVHDMHWGHNNLKIEGVQHNYIRDDPELEYAIQRHIADIPVDTPVIIPTGENRFDGDDWNASEVTKPMFSFSRSESTRASRMISSMTKASALLNYQDRDTVMWENDDGEKEEHIVLAPQDVANMIAIRRVLLTTTHGLDDKKMAVLDAIIETGGMADRDGTALQATIKDIERHIQNNPRIATIGKSQLRKILDAMNEDYLIDIRDNPEDLRENLYVYDGADALGRPNIEDFHDKFADVIDPITGEHISETVRRQQEALGAKNPADVLDTEPTGQQEISSSDLSDVEQATLDALDDTLRGHKVRAESLENMDWEHMLGAAPITNNGGFTEAAGPATTASKEGTVFDPDHAIWNGHNAGQARSAVEQALTSLQQSGHWALNENDDGSFHITVNK